MTRSSKYGKRLGEARGWLAEILHDDTQGLPTWCRRSWCCMRSFGCFRRGGYNGTSVWSVWRQEKRQSEPTPHSKHKLSQLNNGEWWAPLKWMMALIQKGLRWPAKVELPHIQHAPANQVWAFAVDSRDTVYNTEVPAPIEVPVPIEKKEIYLLLPIAFIWCNFPWKWKYIYIFHSLCSLSVIVNLSLLNLFNSVCLTVKL